MVGNSHNQTHIVFYQKNGDIAFADSSDQCRQLFGLKYIKARCWFIQHEKLGPCCKCPGNLKQSLLPIGKTIGWRLTKMSEANLVEQLHCFILNAHLLLAKPTRAENGRCDASAES